MVRDKGFLGDEMTVSKSLCGNRKRLAELK